MSKGTGTKQERPYTVLYGDHAIATTKGFLNQDSYASQPSMTGAICAKLEHLISLDRKWGQRDYKLLREAQSVLTGTPTLLPGDTKRFSWEFPNVGVEFVVTISRRQREP